MGVTYISIDFEKGSRPVEASGIENARVVYFHPQGVQGPILGYAITSAKELKKFDEALGQLSEKDRKNVAEFRKAAASVGLMQVD